MSRVIVIHWESAVLRAMIVRTASHRADIEAVVTVPLEGDDEVASRKLADSLARYASARKPVIATVGRTALTWQHLSLPPCPEDDLPDLVRLQSDFNSNAEDQAGLDYLPLVGDELTAHRVWAISVSPAQLTKFRRIVKGAELQVDHLVPLALGWPAWAKQAAASDSQRAMIWVAPLGAEPSIWATVGDRVVLFRQLQLPQADKEALVTAVAGELRRTLLAFGQEQPQAGDPLIQIVGEHSEELSRLAETVAIKLQRKIETVAADASTGQEESVSQIALPAQGLALEEAAGNPPLVDLLHPRRRPAPRTSKRTYTLAAAAAASLVLLVGWRGYAALQAPLDAVAAAQAEMKLLEASSTTLREAEQRASAIRAWLNGSVNLLDELQVLSTQVRPEPLKAEKYPVDTDIMVAKVMLQNRQFTIDALAKENRVVQPLEYRLRDGVHRVQRGKMEPSEAVPGYPLAFESIVDVTDAAPAAEAPPQ